MFGGQWNVKENTFSPFPIPLNHFTLNLQFFPLALRFTLQWSQAVTHAFLSSSSIYKL